MVTSCNACAHCREMALEDGRFLVSPQRYDALLKTHTVAELEAEGLVRTHPQFRVIALGNTAGVPIGVSSGPNGVTFALSRHRLCRLVVAVVWLWPSSVNDVHPSVRFPLLCPYRGASASVPRLSTGSTASV